MPVNSRGQRVKTSKIKKDKRPNKGPKVKVNRRGPSKKK